MIASLYEWLMTGILCKIFHSIKSESCITASSSVPGYGNDTRHGNRTGDRIMETVPDRHGKNTLINLVIKIYKYTIKVLL